MEHTLFDSVDEMLSPQTMSQLVGQSISSVRRVPFEKSGFSGSKLLAVETNAGQGARYVLKLVPPQRDLMMRVTDDHRCRSVTLWRYGLLDQVKDAIDSTVVACARDETGWAILMRDATTSFLGESPWPRHDYERLLDALAVFHSTFWGAAILREPSLGLCDSAHYLTCASPEVMRAEPQEYALPSLALEGWQHLEDLVEADVYGVVRSLHRDPSPLCRALSRYPQTLVHGDLVPKNIGLMRDPPFSVILVDWHFAAASPPTLDLAFLVRLLPTVAMKERAIEYYHDSLARQLGTRYDQSWWVPQLELGLLEYFVQRAFAIAWAIERGSNSEHERGQHRATLDWFAERVPEAIKRL